MRGMKPGRWKTVSLTLVVLVAVGAFVAWWVNRQPPADTRFTGAYLLDDGRRVYVTPREADVLRYRLEDGASGALYPVGAAGGSRYESGPGWSARTPVELEVEFRGEGEGLEWRPVDGPAQEGRPMDLREDVFTFPSGDLTLRGKLVLPEAGEHGEGPYPAAVLVHGSGDESAVDHYFNPYLFAAHGIATLVFDKRGTGESEGEYTQNFHVLAGDVVAAVAALRERPEIDPSRLHLHGASQGGWIAPLAASRLAEAGEGVRSLVIVYGPMVPIVDEDRWGYVHRLRDRGFGEEAIAEADRIHELILRVLDHGEWERWDELGEALDAAEGEPWFEAAAGSDSTLGFLAETKMPRWMVKAYGKWMMGREIAGEPFADRLYDPVPTVASLDAPSLWIFGGDDSSMPTEWSVEELERLRERGRPIEVSIYPQAEHGILRIEEAEDGSRKLLGYEPEYHLEQVRWLRARSGLVGEPALPATSTNTAFAGPWGVSFAFNLTPDENTGTGIWTEEMFVTALRTGKHMGQSRPLLPPMPWQGYGQMTDEDLAAVFAYLRSVPAIHNRVLEPLPPAGAPGAPVPAAAG